MISRQRHARLYFAIIGWLIGLAGTYIFLFPLLRLVARTLEYARAGLPWWAALMPSHDLLRVAVGILTVLVGQLLLQRRRR